MLIGELKRFNLLPNMSVRHNRRANDNDNDNNNYIIETPYWAPWKRKARSSIPYFS